MKIVNFVICDTTEINSNGVPVIVNPFQLIAFESFPNRYTFTISFGVFDFPLEGASLMVKLISPEGDIVASTNGINFAPQFSKETDESRKTGAQLNLEYRNVVFKNPGEYKVELWLDDRKYREEVLEVVSNDRADA